jgi:putative transposase
VITDTLGFLLGVMVGPASEKDGQRLPDLLQRLRGKVPRLKVIFADGGYEGVPDSLVWRCFHWLLSIVERKGSQSGFEPLPKRWVIERTFSWFGAYRRLNQDYEYCPETSEAMVRLGMSRLMLRRIT